MGPYDDIIGLERPRSEKHPPMPRAERAKQFMPFAALRGYEDALAAQREKHLNTQTGGDTDAAADPGRPVRADALERD